MIKVINASKLSDIIRIQISKIFVDGFYQWLKFFSKDKEKLSQAFSHMFLLENFYVAIIDNKVVGIAACSDGINASIKLNKKELSHHLGIIKGSIAGIVLKKELENHPYPFNIESDCGSIEFVATDENYRTKGIASSIINYILKDTKYKSFVLEVANTNTAAVKCYEKLGFGEYMRIPNKHSKYSGFDYYLYMKYENNIL